MPSLIPEPYIVCHIRRVTSSAINPDTGVNEIVDAPPVIRRAQNLAQIGHRGSSRQIFDTEHLQRIDTELHLAVADPSVYHPQDSVLLFPSVDDAGNYLEGGVEFFVDGIALDARQSPWPVLTKNTTGGFVTLKRVT